eukprot:gene11652-11744_t
MRRKSGLKSGLARLWLIAVVMSPFGSMQAHALDCVGLRASINSTPVTPPSARSVQYSATAAKQRIELDHARNLEQALNCGHSQFLFFGPPRPAQCDSLQARISQLEASQNQLQRAAAMGEGGPRAEMMARYQAACMQRADQQVVQRPRGLFSIFESDTPESAPQDMPVAQDPNLDELTPQRGGSQAICVKTADGSFFPVSYAAGRRDMSNLSELCHALCPASPVTLFTWNPNGDLKNAVDLDGNSYASLPNALKFETKYVPEASCKPANQSWAQVLGPAEDILGKHGKNDIIVTAQKAAELSRVKDPLAGLLGKKKPASPAAPDPVDTYTASLAAATASNNISAGIGGGRTTSGPLIKLSEGELREITGPDGVTRK